VREPPVLWRPAGGVQSDDSSAELVALLQATIDAQTRTIVALREALAVREATARLLREAIDAQQVVIAALSPHRPAEGEAQ
jgi:hypothetical protein